MHAQSLSHVQLFTTPWTVAHQAPLPMGFCGQKHWSVFVDRNTGVGHHFLLPGIELASPVSPALAGRFLTTEPPGKPYIL